MSEQNREWSIAEVAFGEVPPVPVLRLESSPEAFHRSPRRALADAVEAWSVEHDLPLADGVEFGINEDGDLFVVLPGLTLEAGDIVTRQREYRWTGTVTIEVEVSGTVTAVNEDEAHDLAEEALSGLDLDSVELDGYGIVGFEVEGHGVENYEVLRVR